ncbi:type II secretion system F family protein [Paraburkholderia nemoris]|uniref:type II secretion system F family protein n=1 Tax=Paraburkholderia nemoris TaxID=2793076 RepID=UPI00190C6BC6|nr:MULTISPECIES: type II secretion system F family protein [Paraburkholderia]MBK3783651.1 type II secretion protein F [Paraburkholderia aspalathi]
MSSAVMVFAALALLCAAGALLILQRGAQRKDQASTERFIDSRMVAAQPAVSVPASRTATARRMAPALSFSPQAPAPGADWSEYSRYIAARIGYSFATLMNRAGLRKSRMLALMIAGAGLALCLVAANEGGALAAGVTLLACLVFLYFVLSMRANKRRQAIVRQLPSFLDGIVRLITLGNSVPAAFQAALQTTDAPLRECLDHVSRMLRSGVEIDRALSHVAVLYGARELELVGAVLRLSVKYGGRADVMLDRMSSFMRDLEQAERELVAMSSETRLSSWVLGMLPVGIGGFLILTNPNYFGSMWFDPSGRQILYLAFGLQLLGAYLLYRLARLKS